MARLSRRSCQDFMIDAGLAFMGGYYKPNLITTAIRTSLFYVQDCTGHILLSRLATIHGYIAAIENVRATEKEQNIDGAFLEGSFAPDWSFYQFRRDPARSAAKDSQTVC